VEEKGKRENLYYVNTECFWWYIVWRTCFYEDHSSYLPKYHAPLHALYSRYVEISMRFNLAVDVIDPSRFISIVNELQESGNMYISCYWNKPSFTKKRKHAAEREPCVCAVVICDWAIKYERLLRSSILNGFVELKVINGVPVVGQTDHVDVPSKEHEEFVPPSEGPLFDHGEDPLQQEMERSIIRQPQTKMYQETLAFIKRARGSVSEFPLPEDAVRSAEIPEIPEIPETGKGKEPESPERESGSEEMQEEFMKRMEAMTPKEVEEKVKVVISKRIAKIHFDLENESILRQLNQYSYSVLPKGNE